MRRQQAAAEGKDILARQSEMESPNAALSGADQDGRHVNNDVANKFCTC